MAVVTIRLPYVGALDWTSALVFLGRRAIAGVEQVEAGVYRRTVSDGLVSATVVIEHDDGGALLATHDGPAALTPVVTERVRRMFDLDADMAAIAALLRADPALRDGVAPRALRVYRGWSGFEVAVRSIVGQQVSVERARRLNGVLVRRCGRRLESAEGPLQRVFPTPEQVLDADLSELGMPGARIEALRSIARAASSDPQLFDRGPTLDDTIGRLRAIRGVGDWTAHYIAMRACGEPDAFPASDVGLLRGAADEDGRRPTPAELLERAGRWRPWRAYAAHWLWARDAEAGERAARGQGSSIASRRVRSNAPAQTGIWEPPAPDGQTEFNRKRRSAPDRSRRR